MDWGLAGGFMPNSFAVKPFEDNFAIDFDYSKKKFQSYLVFNRVYKWTERICWLRLCRKLLTFA